VQPLVSIEEIRAAAAALAGVAVRTPLVPFPGVDPPLLVKPESLQPTGAFKLRGAYAAVSALPRAATERGVVAHSSGNHGQAVAYAAAMLGMPAVIVVPEDAAPVKVAAIQALGAEIVVSEPTLAARLAATRNVARQRGAVSIPPFDDRRVIAGQGTVGLEIAADCPEVGLVVVPVGGGGLISGVAAAIQVLCPGAVVIGVEPELAADARDSLREGQQVAWPPGATHRTIADALRVDQVGALPLRHMLEYVDDIVTVTEDEIRATVRRLALEGRMIAEPGGAVAVAACLYRRKELPPADTTVAVLSGGNIDPGLLLAILAEAPEPAPEPAPAGDAGGEWPAPGGDWPAGPGGEWAHEPGNWPSEPGAEWPGEAGGDWPGGYGSEPRDHGPDWPRGPGGDWPE
jgi:threonine dehydratase